LLTISKDHVYSDNGRIFDGTTTVIQLEGGSPGLEWVDDWFLQRGKLVHEESARYDLGILDDDKVDPRIKGFLESYKKLRATQSTVYGPEHIEVMLKCDVYGYAGTLDRLGDDGMIRDLKCGATKIADFFQLGSYSGLCRANKRPVKGAEVVYLNEDGTEPHVVPCTVRQLREYLDDFYACLRWHRAKQLDVPR
jgi:hypothetical protein